MIASLIAKFLCLFAQPRSRGVVYLAGSLRYTHRQEIAVRSQGMRQIPLLRAVSGGPRDGYRGLGGVGEVIVRNPRRGLNLHS